MANLIVEVCEFEEIIFEVTPVNKIVQVTPFDEYIVTVPGEGLQGIGYMIIEDTFIVG